MKVCWKILPILAEVFKVLPQRRRGRRVDLMYLVWNNALFGRLHPSSPCLIALPKLQRSEGGTS
jgi:hypothetical protein